MEEIEHFFRCPYCRSKISMLLDTTVERQDYIEDCEVCCQPIGIGYNVVQDEIQNFSAASL